MERQQSDQVSAKPQPEVVALAEVGAIRGRVLDVGCGAGDNAIYLASQGLEVVAFDGAPEAVARAEAKAKAARVAGLTFQVADVLALSIWTEFLTQSWIPRFFTASPTPSDRSMLRGSMTSCGPAACS